MEKILITLLLLSLSILGSTQGIIKVTFNGPRNILEVKVKPGTSNVPVSFYITATFDVDSQHTYEAGLSYKFQEIEECSKWTTRTTTKGSTFDLEISGSCVLPGPFTQDYQFFVQQFPWIIDRNNKNVTTMYVGLVYISVLTFEDQQLQQLSHHQLSTENEKHQVLISERFHQE